MSVVLQKYLAEAGHCSRRQAEDLIRAGKVEVNGEAADLGARVGDNDEVRVGGRLVRAETEKIYIIMNKPAGYVCTSRRFPGEKNIFDLLSESKKKKPKQKLFAVGRLDKTSEGLVLLTNDGDLAYKLTHPKYEHEKEYLVQLTIKNLQLSIKEIINKFKQGVDIGAGELGRAKEVDYLGDGKFKIILTEGKNRQIRRMFAFFGLDVLKLQRVRMGAGRLKFELGNLKKGEWKYILLGR